MEDLKESILGSEVHSLCVVARMDCIHIKSQTMIAAYVGRAEHIHRNAQIKRHWHLNVIIAVEVGDGAYGGTVDNDVDVVKVPCQLFRRLSV